MSDQGLHAVPERFSITRIDIRHGTLHQSTYAVTLAHCLIKVAHLNDLRLNTRERCVIQHGSILKHLLGYHSGSHDR